MTEEARIGFDTSVFNALEREGAGAETLLKEVTARFHLLLFGLAAGEILSTPTKKAIIREALLARCQRLLASGQCLWPPHYVIKLLISEHSKNPAQFDWTKVDVRARVYERAIIDRDFTEPLCVQQRKEQFEAEENWARMWKGVKLALDKFLATDPSQRPSSYHDVIVITTVQGGALGGFGRILYSRITGRDIAEAEIMAFMDVCPPFRATCYALVMDLCVHGLGIRLQGDLPPAGRNDLMMAAYLPYCGQFVTDDKPQEVSLRSIAAEASIACDVLAYESFRAGVLVAV